MLTKKIADALNKQVTNEAYASSSYLAMASWCEREGFRGCADFFYKQSDEEREHMLKMFKYINEAGNHAKVLEINEPKAIYKSIGEVFEQALEQEQGVTASINRLVSLSLEGKDYATFHFLQWYVEEQREEETLFRCALDVIRLAGKDQRSLLLVDKEIPRLRAAEGN